MPTTRVMFLAALAACTLTLGACSESEEQLPADFQGIGDPIPNGYNVVGGDIIDADGEPIFGAPIRSRVISIHFNRFLDTRTDNLPEHDPARPWFVLDTEREVLYVGLTNEEHAAFRDAADTSEYFRWDAEKGESIQLRELPDPDETIVPVLERSGAERRRLGGG